MLSTNTEDDSSESRDDPRRLSTKQSTGNVHSAKFPYERMQKLPLDTSSDEFKKFLNLIDVDNFWRKKDINLVDDFMDSLEYVSRVKLTQRHLEKHPQDALKLFHVVQCLLEIRDTDALNAEDLEEDLSRERKENEKLKQDVDALQKEAQSLKNDSQSRQGKIHKRELEDKDSEIAEWRKRCYDKDVVISDINASLDEAKRRVREFEGKEVKMEQKIRRYKDEVSSLAAMEKKMRGRNAEDDSLINRLEDEVELLKTEREEMRTELEENTDRMLQLQNQLDDAKKEENSLKQTIRANQNEINERIRDTEERSKEVVELRETLENLQDQHEHELNALEDGFLADIERLQQQNQALLDELQAKSEMVASMHTQMQGKPPQPSVTRAPSHVENLRRGSQADSIESSTSEKMATFDDGSADLVRELQDENASLRGKVRALEDMIHDEESDKFEEKANIEDLLSDNLQQELEAIRPKKEHLEDELHLTQEAMRDMEREIIHLKQKIKAYEDGVSGLEIANRDIRYHKEQLVKREETIERHKKLLNVLLNNIEDLRWTILGLYKEHNTPKSKQIDVNKMNEDIERKILEELLRNERRRLNDSSKSLDALKREHDSDLRKLQGEINKLVEEVKHLSQQNSVLRADNDATQGKLHSATVHIEDLESQLAQPPPSIVPATPIPQVEVSMPLREPQPGQAPHSLIAKYDKLKSKFETVSDELARLRRDNMSDELETLRTKHDKALHEISVLHGSKSSLQQENASLKKELESTLGKMKHLSKEDKNHRQRMEQLLGEMSTVKREKDTLQQQLEKTMGLIRQFKEKPDDVREVIKPDNALVSRLEQQIRAAQAQLSTLRLNFDAEKQAHSSTKRMLLDVETKLSNLRREYEDLRHDNALSVQRADALKQQLENAQRELHLASSQGSGDANTGSTYQVTALRKGQKQIRDLMRQLDDAKDEIATLNGEVASLKEMQEGSKTREEEWKKIQERLAYYEQTLQSDQNNAKEQARTTMKQIIAGYNAIISQKEATIQKYTTELESMRREMLSDKRIHQDELDGYKRLLKNNDSKLLENLHANASSIENEPRKEPGPPEGMALEDVEEMMAEKNYMIYSLQEEVNGLRHELSDLKKRRGGQIQTYFATKKRLEEEVLRQEKEIAELTLSVRLHETQSLPFAGPSATDVINSPKKNSITSSSPLRASSGLAASGRMKKLKSQLETERENKQILQQKVNNLTTLLKKQQLQSTQKIEEEQMASSAKDLTRFVNKRTAELRKEASLLKKQVEQLNLELFERSQMIERLQDKHVRSVRDLKHLEDQLRSKSKSHSDLKKRHKYLEKEIYALRMKDTLGVGRSTGTDEFSDGQGSELGMSLGNRKGRRMAGA